MQQRKTNDTNRMTQHPPVHLHLPVLNAMRTLIDTYAGALVKRGQPPIDAAGVIISIDKVLQSEHSFLEKVKAVDAIVSANEQLMVLKEFCFDLLMVNFLAAEVEAMDEDYLESAEWSDIEEKTITRGTELLSLLLYLNESMEDEVEISLHDFLTEFLLADDDEFQDEHHIYESIITNQHLLEADLDEMIATWNDVKEDSEIADLFIPMLIFFADSETSGEEEIAELMKVDRIPAEQVAVLDAVYSFKNSFQSSIQINSN